MVEMFNDKTEKVKSSRNRTLTISADEKRGLEQSLLEISEQTSLSKVINSTILGDSFSVLELLPRKSVDLLIADPPYNLSKEFHGNKFSIKSNKDYEDYTREWVEKSVPLLKNDGSMYVCCDWKSSPIIGKVLSEYLVIRNRITWQREKGRGSKNNWKNGSEDIWYATNSNKKYTFNVEDVLIRRKVIAPYRVNGKPKDWEETAEGNFRNTYPSNFWDDITIPFWSMPENTDHPTQKPEKLIAKLILASSNERDVVLDPFLGSGTSSVVAKKLGRQYIGIEWNQLYCLWAQKRLNNVINNQSIQGYSDGVFWERNTLQYLKKNN